MPYSWEPSWLGIRVDLERLNAAPGDRIDPSAWPKLMPEQGSLVTMNQGLKIPEDVLGLALRARLVDSKLTMVVARLQSLNANSLARTVNYLGEGALCAPQLSWELQAFAADRIPLNPDFCFTAFEAVRWTVVMVTQPWEQSWTRFRFGGWKRVSDDSRPGIDVKYD